MILPNNLHIDMVLDVSYLALSKIAHMSTRYSILSFYFLNMHQLIHIAKLVYNKFDA